MANPKSDASTWFTKFNARFRRGNYENVKLAMNGRLGVLICALMVASCSKPAQPTAAPAPVAPTQIPQLPSAEVKVADVAIPTEAPKPTIAPTVPPTPTAKPKSVIKLAENPWAGSTVNVYVAKQIIEQKLGYKVEIVTIDENAQFPALSNNELSASLEVWPSGHAEDEDKFITKAKTVERIGDLGIVGEIGWYLPTYMTKDKPELATWEGVKKNATLFKSAETGNRGRFLLGDPSWVSYDDAII